MKILTVANVPPDPNSGAAGTVWATNQAFRAAGHEVDEVWAADLAPRRIRHGNFHSLLEQPRRYRREVVRRVGADVHAYDLILMSQPQSYLAARWLRRRGFRGVVLNRSHGVELRVDRAVRAAQIVHGERRSRLPWVTDVLQRLLTRQWREVARDSDGVVVPCEDDRQCVIIETSATGEQVRVVPHGVSDLFLNTPLAQDTDARLARLLHVGQYAFVKGSTLLPAIVEPLLREREDLTFTWVTTANVHAAIREQFSPEVRDRVELLDWVPREKLLEVYDAHSLFLFPSIAEGAAKACMEAMSRGLCVVATTGSGMGDAIDDGVSGRLCSVGDVSDFRGAIRECLARPADSATFGRAARERVVSQTWAACAEQIISWTEEFLERKHPTAPATAEVPG